MTQGVPSKAPNHVVVGVVNHTQLRLRASTPVVDGAIPTARGEEVLVDRVPDHAGDLLLVTAEGLHLLLHEAQVKKFNQVITRGGEEPIAVGIPRNVCTGVLVSVAEREMATKMCIGERTYLMTHLTHNPYTCITY